MILGKKFDQTVFVLSTGRTATKALARYFDDCYADVVARHEPAPSRILRIASHLRLAGRVGPASMQRLLLACRYPAIERLAGGTYLEANWYLLGFLDVLDRTFANARVVHVTRDPATFITSMMNFSHLNRVKALTAPILPYWILRPRHLSPSGRATDLSPPEYYAWLWTTMNAHLEKGADLFGERYLRVRYEDLFAEDAKGLEGLAEWLGLPAIPRLAEVAAGNRIHASRDRGFGKTLQPDPSTRAMLAQRCGELMDRYGYDLPQS